MFTLLRRQQGFGADSILGLSCAARQRGGHPWQELVLWQVKE